MQYYVMMLCIAVLLQGCNFSEKTRKISTPNSLRECLEQRPMVSFKDPAAKTLVDKENISLGNIRIFCKADMEKIFKDVFPGEIIEKKSAVQNGIEEKTFIINQQVVGIPVFAASTVLRCTSDGKIIYFSCNFSVSATKIKNAPRQFPPEMQKKFFGDEPKANIKNIIFDPALVGKKDKVVMTWQIDANGQRTFIDQQTEKKIYSYPLYVPIGDMNKKVK